MFEMLCSHNMTGVNICCNL